MTITEYTQLQPSEWQTPLLTLHGLILHHDPGLTAGIAPMMGRQMIVYQEQGHF